MSKMKKTVLVMITILAMVSCSDDMVVFEKQPIKEKRLVNLSQYDSLHVKSVKLVHGQEDDMPEEE